jgi:hypothetical protein
MNPSSPLRVERLKGTVLAIVCTQRVRVEAALNLQFWLAWIEECYLFATSFRWIRSHLHCLGFMATEGVPNDFIILGPSTDLSVAVAMHQQGGPHSFIRDCQLLGSSKEATSDRRHRLLK